MSCFGTKCGECNGTGVIDTGNNDLPCNCGAGDTVLFNQTGVRGPVSGEEVRRHFLNNSREPIQPGRDGIDAAYLPGRKAYFEKPPSLDMDAYQDQAYRTSGMRTLDDHTLAVCALGVSGEAGEVAGYVKKFISHGHELDREKLVNELGDVMWYVAVMAKLLGARLSTVAEKNIEKLKRRYPDGFSTDRSRNRESDR